MIDVVDLQHAFKIGKKGREKNVPVLRNINFKVQEGEIISIVGRSGSGKSTLLHVIAGFLKPDSGEISVHNVVTSSFNEAESAKFRLDNFGFIFQNFQLMPSLTTIENIELPLKLQGVGKEERNAKVRQLLQQVGLVEVQHHFPNELSGGQQQRVSIARALITNPPIIFADEPTGSLDSETEQEILALIHSLNQKKNITFVIITHDDEVAKAGHRIYRMHDGKLTEEREYDAI